MNDLLLSGDLINKLSNNNIQIILSSPNDALNPSELSKYFGRSDLIVKKWPFEEAKTLDLREAKASISFLIYNLSGKNDLLYKNRQKDKVARILDKKTFINLERISAIPFSLTISKFIIAQLRQKAKRLFRKTFQYIDFPHFDTVFVIGSFQPNSLDDLAILLAKQRKVRSVLYYRSHDSLTSKSSVLASPNICLVQNEFQSDFVHKRHRLRSKVIVSGSLFFDKLYLRQENKCIEANLRDFAPDSRRFSLCFLSSSKTNFPGEIEFIAQQIEHVENFFDRNFDIRIRAHPSVARYWKQSRLSHRVIDIPDLLWDRAFENSENEQAFDGFFMVNTSGLLDMMVRFPNSFFFSIFNLNAKGQQGTSHYLDFIECGLREYPSLVTAIQELSCIKGNSHFALDKLLPNLGISTEMVAALIAQNERDIQFNKSRTFSKAKVAAY